MTCEYLFPLLRPHCAQLKNECCSPCSVYPQRSEMKPEENCKASAQGQLFDKSIAGRVMETNNTAIRIYCVCVCVLICRYLSSAVFH